MQEQWRFPDLEQPVIPERMLRPDVYARKQTDAKVMPLPKELYTIWRGSVYWQGSFKYDSVLQPRVVRRLSCKVSCRATASGDTSVNPYNWPNELSLQLIPEQIVSKFGKEYIKNARYVACDLSESKVQDLDILTRAMTHNYVGLINLNTPTWEFRVMILLYSPAKSSFIGVITHNQKDFVASIKQGFKAHDRNDVGELGIQRLLLQLDHLEQGIAANLDGTQRIPPRNAHPVAVTVPSKQGFDTDEDETREQDLEEFRQLGLAIDRDQQLVKDCQARNVDAKVPELLAAVPGTNVTNEFVAEYLFPGDVDIVRPYNNLTPEQREQRLRKKDKRRLYLNQPAYPTLYEQRLKLLARTNTTRAQDPPVAPAYPDAADVTMRRLEGLQAQRARLLKIHNDRLLYVAELGRLQKEQYQKMAAASYLRERLANNTAGRRPPNNDAIVYDQYRVDVQPVQERTEENGNPTSNGDPPILQRLLKLDEAQPSTSTGVSISKEKDLDFGLDIVTPLIQDTDVPSLKRKHADCSLPLKTKRVKLTQNAALAIDEAFSCLVCQVPMRHPVFTSCCKSLVACRECSTDWSSRSNNCLKCQAENPVYTEVLGLHEGIRALVDCNIFD